jgi:rubrerythrin
MSNKDGKKLSPIPHRLSHKLPKKKRKVFYCPICGEYIKQYTSPDKCQYCRQPLDWSNTK